MRMIGIEEYDERTMQLAKPICDSRRRVLLGAGNVIHPKYREKLEQIGIKYLFIEDFKSKGISLEEMMDMPTWLDIITVTENAYKAAETNQPLPLPEIQKAVKKLISEVQKRNAIMLIPTTAVDQSLFLYAHAVNVTLIALQIGKKIGHTYTQLNNLGIGCLLHDIGKTRTSNKEEHPEIGFNIIRVHREINLVSAHIAYQHHETIDGKGFPRSLAGNDILEFAQICSLANDYDHLISQDGIMPHEAIEQIMTFSEKKYSHHIVLAFSQGIISYPPGTNVQLNIGSKGRGIVTRIESNPHRPIVRLLELNKEINLNQHPTIIVETILKEENHRQLI
ncbi:HD-GYP domain-containing protein [Halalkalibacter alkaliphilus]|uniref:HD domain-containing protein n=1 Tax=Halalkalibacter alkaliphilus TaxID=2917993 RepID=A0A9X1ZXW2_9BACI|nr:HD domain-containing phosphohydrolase [Halalkalibacter alkaliphilus]MCL7746718.1 HD domain-containing protein [Halalkalibacter alkaliphilus]